MKLSARVGRGADVATVGEGVKIKQFTLVEVTWVDSMSTRGWRTPEEVDEWFNEDVIMTSVGYFYKQTKKKIAIVGSHDSQKSPMLNQYHEVPTCAVLSIKVLKR